MITASVLLCLTFRGPVPLDILRAQAGPCVRVAAVSATYSHQEGRAALVGSDLAEWTIHLAGPEDEVREAARIMRAAQAVEP